MNSAAPLKICIIAGEKSGDDLGAKLILALRELVPSMEFCGVGGEAMQAQGLKSWFPLADIAVMGIVAVVARLPTIVRRVYQTVNEIGAAQPDLLLIIDSPDFTHAVARRVRKRWPSIPIVDYVSPTVWAWRPGRARAMRAYTDHLLALLPFEPEAHARLGGPPCTYVGHPLIERLAELRPGAQDSAARNSAAPTILVLPGSRGSEIAYLMDEFGKTVALLARENPQLQFVLPAVAHVEAQIREKLRTWPVQPRIIRGEAEKYAAFRVARAALAASGTVTLELALAQVPTVVAYKVSKLEEPLRHFITVSSIVLPNLILGENAVPEFLQEKCKAELMAPAMMALIGDTPERATQLQKLEALESAMQVPQGRPALVAARKVLALLQARGKLASSKPD